jgi:hypothetical protein
MHIRIRPIIQSNSITRDLPFSYRIIIPKTQALPPHENIHCVLDQDRRGCLVENVINTRNLGEFIGTLLKH